MTSAATSSAPTRKAAAPAPYCISWALAGRARGRSDPMTKVGCLAACRALANAATPARCEPPKSRARTVRCRRSATATMALDCKSAVGAVVEARSTSATFARSRRPRHSRAASTAIVTTSSSQQQYARRPRASPFNEGAIHACVEAMTARSRRRRGIWAPQAVIPNAMSEFRLRVRHPARPEARIQADPEGDDFIHESPMVI